MSTTKQNHRISSEIKEQVLKRIDHEEKGGKQNNSSQKAGYLPFPPVLPVEAERQGLEVETRH